MRVEELIVEVRDAALQRVGSITPEYRQMKIVPRANDVGSWSLTLPGEHPMVPKLEAPGSGIVVTQRVEDTPAVPETYAPAASPSFVNLFTNPSFETADGTVEVRRNFCTDPHATGIGTLWSSATPSGNTTSYDPTAAQDGGSAFSIATTATGPLRIRTEHTASIADIPVGQTAALSMYVFAPEAATGCFFEFFWTRTDGSNYPRSTTFSLVPGWNHVVGTLVVASGVTAFSGDLQLVTGSTVSASKTWLAYGAMVEASPTANTYFDYNHSPDPDLTPSATGTPNESPAILSGDKVAGITTTLGYQSTHWAALGSHSLYVPTGGTATITLASASTVLATARNSGQTVTVTGDTATSATTDEALTVYGTTTVTLGPGWWDDILLVEGDYSGGYFDGDTPDDSPLAPGYAYDWDDLPDASTSSMTQIVIDTPRVPPVPQYRVLMSGPTTLPKSVRNRDNVDRLLTFDGVGDTIIAADAVAFGDPANEVGAQTSANDTRTAVGETLMRAYVDVNIGSGALVSRRGGMRAAVTLATDLGRGPFMTKSPRFQNLLDLLREIATYSSLRFRFVQIGDSIVFEVDDAHDRTALVRLDIENGTLASEEIEQRPASTTRAILAGQGEGTDRLIIERTSTESLAAEAQWGRVIERFLDARDKSLLTELQQQGDEFLIENGATAYAVKANASDSQTMLYGVDWVEGDIVAVVIDGVEYAVDVTSAAIVMNADGVLVGAAIGDVAKMNESATVEQRVDQNEQRISTIERTTEGVSGVSEPTPGKIVTRDTAGRAQFADPAVAADAATKGYTDGKTWDAGSDLTGIVQERNLPTRLRATALQVTGDWNNVLDGGWYWGLSLTNTPPGLTYVHMFVIRHDSNHVVQTAYGLTGSDQVWVRWKLGSTTWTTWRQQADRAYVDSATVLPGRLAASNFLGQGIDPDNLLETGFYSSHNWVGSLSGYYVGTLIVNQYSPNWISQQFTTVAATPVMLIRSYHSGTTWGAWRTVTTT